MASVWLWSYFYTFLPCNQQFASQFSYHCTSLIFQHYVMCDTTRQNGGSGETDVQVRILIYHLLMALRGVYKKTGIVDDPVIYNLENRGGGLRIQGLTA